MTVFAPGQLAAWSRGCWTAPPAVPITGFTNDTRALAPGQLFVALKSGRRDGHDFLAAAAAAGAAGAVVGRADPACALPPDPPAFVPPAFVPPAPRSASASSSSATTTSATR